VRAPEQAERWKASLAGAHRLLTRKYYVDELYDAAVVQPTKWFSTQVLWQRVDVRTIDGLVNHLAAAAKTFGSGVRQIQSGNTRSYATWVVIGALLFSTLLALLMP
jgi:NADH-quinone oxidoreductase subunit L